MATTMPLLDLEVWLGQEQREMGIPPKIVDREVPAMVWNLQKVILTGF